MRQLQHHGTYSRDGLVEIAAVWRESIQVASICYVLARHYTHVPPDQALLTGLLHAVGRLYVVMRAEQEDDLTGVDVREIANGWQAAIGKAILDSWGLPEAMQDAVEQQDERDAEFPGVSLIDVLIAAKVLAAAEDDGGALPRCSAIARLSAAKNSDAAAALETHGEEIQALRLSFGD